MAEWTNDELSKIDAVDELRIQSRRRDGSLRSPVTIWMVRLGDELYARSVNGRDGAWFRGASARHEGRIRAGGVEKEVTFVDADREINDAVDAAYRVKYRRYAARIVDSLLSPQARAAKLRLVPQETSS